MGHLSVPQRAWRRECEGTFPGCWERNVSVGTGPRHVQLGSTMPEDMDLPSCPCWLSHAGLLGGGAEVPSGAAWSRMTG